MLKHIKLFVFTTSLIITALVLIVITTVIDLNKKKYKDSIKNTEIVQNQPTSSDSQAAPNIEEPLVTLQEEKYIDGYIKAYKLSNPEGVNTLDNSFTVVYESTSSRPYHASITSAHDSSFDVGNKLFNILEETLMVLNAQTNKIDVYDIDTYVLSVNSEGHPQATTASLYYKESISTPPYAVGRIYDFECQDNVCKIKTRHHLESGCTMNYSLLTKVYSDIECSNYGGNFEPAPL